MVAETEVKLGVHKLADAGVDIITVDVAPCDRHLRVADNMGETAVFIAKRLGNDKCDVHVAALPHATGKAIAGSTEAAEDMRREFPTEH